MQGGKLQHNHAKARRLRAEMSLPEVLLWRLLRKQPMGMKFRRQHPVGKYVIDFCAPAVKLGFEVDGIIHDMGDNPLRDIARDTWLGEQGIDIIRIPAKEVLRSPIEVADSIVRTCQGRS
jgi:very-short-patch-repair endonuclease